MSLLATALLALTGATLATGQVHRSGPFTGGDQSKLTVDHLPTLDLIQLPSLRQIAAENPAEHARAARYDSQDPSAPAIYNPSTKKVLIAERSVHYLSKDPLPTDDSDVVAVGLISSEMPHVSLDGTMLYSTFNFSPLQILKGGAQSTMLSLERIGGVALFPDGSKHLIGESGIGLPEVGHKYLLFLKRLSNSSFQIETGFCVDSNNPISLDIYGDRVEQRGLSSAGLIASVLNKVHKK